MITWARLQDFHAAAVIRAKAAGAPHFLYRRRTRFWGCVGDIKAIPPDADVVIRVDPDMNEVLNDIAAAALAVEGATG